MKINVKGKVVMQVGVEKKTYRVEDVKLALGEKFSLGDHEFEIVDTNHKPRISTLERGNKHAGKNGATDGILHVAIKADVSKKRILGISLYATDHSKMPVFLAMNQRNGPFGPRAVSYGLIDLYIFGKPETATIETEIWEGTREVEVPIDIEVGLGLE